MPILLMHKEVKITGRFRVAKSTPVWRFQCEALVAIIREGKEIGRYTSWRNARKDDMDCAEFRSRHAEDESAPCAPQVSHA